MSIHQPPRSPILFSFPDTDTLKVSLASFVLKAQKEAISKKGRFTIALSGGSLPKMLSALHDSSEVKWDQWYALYVHVAFP